VAAFAGIRRYRAGAPTVSAESGSNLTSNARVRQIDRSGDYGLSAGHSCAIPSQARALLRTAAVCTGPNRRWSGFQAAVSCVTVSCCMVLAAGDGSRII
jgi:hypothetical protein